MRTDAAGWSATTITLWIVGGSVVLAVVAGFLGRAFIRRGKRQPFVVRLINRASEGVVEIVKRPITIAVLDEVADVLRTGHYTRNIASGIQENRAEIKAMVAEKIKEDPAAGHISLVPFHDKLIENACETTIRVILEVLADPRTDELFSDVLRDNIDQIRATVRSREYKNMPPPDPPDPTSPRYAVEPPPPP
ncbi:hypothetical protein [Jatrophihabitans fulvus]